MTETRAAAAASPDQPQAHTAPLGASPDRIASLDFIRGIAVMGILAANIIAFGQPFAAYMYPDAFLTPHGEAEGWMWVAQFVLVDGKMRALFSLLFGAGLYLFLEKAWERGQGRWLQVRRLLWLGLFGLFHFFFIWKGDILFLYAVSGLAVLPFVKMARRNQFILGVLGYIVGGIVYAGMAASMVMSANGAIPGDEAARAEVQAVMVEAQEEEIAQDRIDGELIASGDYPGLVERNLTESTTEPLTMLLLFWLETLPLMLMGMALYRKGLFSGGVDRRKQMIWGWAGVLVGGALTLWIALMVRAGGFGYWDTIAAFIGWSHFPRLFMGLGLLALLALWGERVSGWLALRVSAAGRAAFTNYLGTSVVMMLVFHGWAGGLFGELTRGGLYGVVVLAWALMLLWSKPWLDRYRYGPLEWLWRCLTYGRRFPLRR
jgi:uncharacterized protein